jgi:hypothetical protein
MHENVTTPEKSNHIFDFFFKTGFGVGNLLLSKDAPVADQQNK